MNRLIGCVAPFRHCALLLIALALLPNLRGQTPAVEKASPPSATTGDPPAYDIISIKPSKDNRSGYVDISVNDDLFSARDASIKTLLAEAYSINRDHIDGLPKWALNQHYDVQAKMLNPDRTTLHNLTREQRAALLEPMLADRFRLKAHTESRILPVYELLVIKDGPKFSPAVQHQGSNGIGIHNAQLTATTASMSELAIVLSPIVHRTVINQTDLTGKYDFTCNWTSPYVEHGSEEDSEASLFTALQEQLGLKLRSAKAPVTVLVVDHVEMPSPD